LVQIRKAMKERSRRTRARELETQVEALARLDAIFEHELEKWDWQNPQMSPEYVWPEDQHHSRRRYA
jgi:hypothetical protein